MTGRAVAAFVGMLMVPTALAGSLILTMTSNMRVSGKQNEVIAAQDHAIEALKSQIAAQGRVIEAQRSLIAGYREGVEIRDKALAARAR